MAIAARDAAAAGLLVSLLSKRESGARIKLAQKV
jgi:hypothetical protein